MSLNIWKRLLCFDFRPKSKTALSQFHSLPPCTVKRFLIIVVQNCCKRLHSFFIQLCHVPASLTKKKVYLCLQLLDPPVCRPLPLSFCLSNRPMLTHIPKPPKKTNKTNEKCPFAARPSREIVCVKERERERLWRSLPLFRVKVFFYFTAVKARRFLSCPPLISLSSFPSFDLSLNCDPKKKPNLSVNVKKKLLHRPEKFPKFIEPPVAFSIPSDLSIP